LHVTGNGITAECSIGDHGTVLGEHDKAATTRYIIMPNNGNTLMPNNHGR
jgi:hypothetical protein